VKAILSCFPAMTVSRQGGGQRAGVLFKPLLFLLVCALSPPSFVSAISPTSPDIAPERDIVTTGPDKEPEWKELWDEARELARRKRYSESARVYAQLLSLKKNIEEAAWEYSQVLITLSDWERASTVLENLLETDPHRADYLLSAGSIALQRKEYGRAVTCYRLVYQKTAPALTPVQDDSRSPVSGTESRHGSENQKDERAQSKEALTGLIAALQWAGKIEDAYPLMEKLFQLSPDDHDLLHRLAVHSVKSGRREKALAYYGKLVARESVADHVLLEAAEIFERFGGEAKKVPRASADAPSKTNDPQPSMAFVCWEKYLRRHPDYLPFQKKIAEYLLARGEKVATLPHLLILLSQDENREQYLLRVGEIYLVDLGRPEKALSYYEEYFQRHPENQEVGREISRMRSTLAHDLVTKVGRQSAGSLWQGLAPITPNRLAIYASMVELLEQREDKKELGETLAIIHQHDPENSAVVLRLSELALERQDLEQAEHFLNLLSPTTLERQQEVRYLLARARQADQQKKNRLALDWYTRYQAMAPGNPDIRRRCMELSASLGLIHQYEQHYLLLRHDAVSEQERLTVDLQYVRVLLANGLATKAAAMGLQLIDAGAGGTQFLAECRLVLADALYAEGNLFEAEQVLRQMLVDDMAVDAALYKLVEFAIESREPELAQAWFTLLTKQPGAIAVPATGDNDGNNLSLLQARMLAAAGKPGKAIELLMEYRQSLERQPPHETTRKKQVDLLLSHLYLLDQQDDKGRKLIAGILKEYPNDLEALIIDRQLNASRSDRVQEDRVDEVLAGTYNNEFPILMQAARFERKVGASEAALRHLRMALREVPESLTARVAFAEILSEQGDAASALTSWQTLAAEYPQELGFARQLLEAEFNQALFPQIIAKLVPAWSQGFGNAIMLLPDTSHLLAWQKLILARTLWAERQWVAAVAIYDTLLQPSVEKSFTEKMAEQRIQLVLPPPRQSLWNVITFTVPAEPDRLTQVMDPVFVLSRKGQAAGRIGVEFYARYRWQKLAARELSARRALAQGNYYQAMKEYQEVIAKDPSPESLFDLAGIYSRLGMLGKEALLYEELERENPEYPHLAEAVERNTLKRRPKGMVNFDYSSFSGRDGYLDIKQTQGGGSVWMLPTLRQEMSASWSTIHAVSGNTDQDLWRNRFVAEYSFYPYYAVDFVAKIGGDKKSGNADEESGNAHHDIIPLYHFETRGRIGDELHGFARLTQDVVDDTVQALKEGISKRDLESGVSVDLLPRLFCGGEYLYSEYSDANHQNRYHVWVSYILFTEPTLLRVTYGQELLHNAESNLGQNLAYDGLFAPGDHPYWSPSEYWQNLVSVHFEHQLAADVFGRSAPSYYTLDYSFGYEEGGYDNHSFGGNIFLEMSRHFLLNSKFDLIQGGQEIRKDIAVSLVYRW